MKMKIEKFLRFVMEFGLEPKDLVSHFRDNMTEEQEEDVLKVIVREKIKNNKIKINIKKEVIKDFLCRIGLHKWKYPTRINETLYSNGVRRFCSWCFLEQHKGYNWSVDNCDYTHAVSEFKNVGYGSKEYEGKMKQGECISYPE